MRYKPYIVEDLISLPEAADLRNCSHQAISELVKKNRFIVREISGHKYLSKREVVEYEPAATGRPRKKKRIRIRREHDD
jgi:predicted DNA-binding protein YlxM (UPF0122 family)